MKIIGMSEFVAVRNHIKTICLIDDSGDKYTVDSINGWQKVNRFPIMHYRVKPYTSLSEVFDLSSDYVNMDYFELKSRFSEIKRKIWIFKGASLTGKTFLSNMLWVNKYETDLDPQLPDIFYEEVIVLGNKYNFTVEDVVSRIYEKDLVDIIIVDFNRYSEI